MEIENICFIDPWSKQSFEDEFELNDYSELFAADVDGALQGYSVMVLISGEAHINNIATHPDFRRLGIGRMLIKK